MTDSPPAMTVRDVAAYLNVNEKTVYRLAQRRELPGFKVAGAWRFQRQDIDQWIQRQKTQPEPGAARRG
jgi:excisionase family DNA binding protein